MENKNRITVFLSAKTVANINSNRKRPFRPDCWKRNIAKLNRAKGDPYYSLHNGVLKPGKIPPTQAKECVRCTKPNCQALTLENKLAHFKAYYGLANYNDQRTFLLQLIELKSADGCSTNNFRYNLRINGKLSEVCRETFLRTFQITPGVVKELQKRLLRGEIIVNDLRGRHGNQPKKIEVKGEPKTESEN